MTRVREAMTAAALLTVVGVALAMQKAGLSASLGAFIAGALLAESSYRHQLEADIQPFQGLLLGLFFTAVGMSLNLKLIAAEPGAVFGIALGAGRDQDARACLSRPPAGSRAAAREPSRSCAQPGRRVRLRAVCRRLGRQASLRDAERLPGRRGDNLDGRDAASARARAAACRAPGSGPSPSTRRRPPTTATWSSPASAATGRSWRACCAARRSRSRRSTSRPSRSSS